MRLALESTKLPVSEVSFSPSQLATAFNAVSEIRFLALLNEMRLRDVFARVEEYVVICKAPRQKSCYAAVNYYLRLYIYICFQLGVPQTLRKLFPDTF